MHSVHRKSLYEYLMSKVQSDVQYYCLVYFLMPGIATFQLVIIYPNLVVRFEAGIAKQMMHICLISFCFVNVVGNVIFSMMMDSSLKKPVTSGGRYCEHCHMMQPARSWHCMKCNVCIRKRDHHCYFLARCIGLNNQRYFILFLGHIVFTLLYLTYYNYYFAMLNYSVKEDKDYQKKFVPNVLPRLDMFVIYMILNVCLLLFSISLFFIHIRNAVRGVTAYEARFPELRDSSKWKQNMLNIFGTKWYLAMVWPMCESPLPKDDKQS